MTPGISESQREPLQQRGPFWTPITPRRGSFFHADPHLKDRPPLDALWVTERGTKLSRQAAYYAFRRTTEMLLGRAVNPHAARHTIATGLVQANPRAPSVAAAALGHRGIKSMLSVYDRTRSEGALREWARLKRRVAKAGKS